MVRREVSGVQAAELLSIVSRGEDSRHQFKQDATNANSLAAELVAFANCGGGQIFLGVEDTGTCKPLSSTDVGRINQLLASAAANGARPPINPITENVQVDGGVVIVVTVGDGLSRPYMDGQGAIWVKSGSDKRRVTSREEMQRMVQSAMLVYADTVPVAGTSIADVDPGYFEQYFRAQFGLGLEEQELPLEQIFTNMRLLQDGQLTVAGMLLFGRHPAPWLPAFHVKAVCYPGNDIHASVYQDSADLTGRLQSQFEDSLSFVMRNLRRLQNGQGVNSVGQLEVPRLVLEELLANAVMHRDYFLSAPIRIFVFDDRIEILSPGHLPNHLTVANIRAGNSNIRNPILASYAAKLLPYRGLGNGILRSLRAYPNIEFQDDREGNLFRVIVQRPAVVRLP
jgi:ATP-dependent DNA helicase RecG